MGIVDNVAEIMLECWHERSGEIHLCQVSCRRGSGFGRVQGTGASSLQSGADQGFGEQIFKDYQNEAEADKKYLGKLVEVDGMVDKTGMDPTGQFYALLKGGDAVGSVICYFPKKMNDLSGEIKPGMPLVVRGIVLNRLMNVVIDECAVVKG